MSKLECNVEVMHNISVAPKCFDLVSRHSKGNGIDRVSSRHVVIMISELLSRLKRPVPVDVLHHRRSSLSLALLTALA